CARRQIGSRVHQLARGHPGAHSIVARRARAAADRRLARMFHQTGRAPMKFFTKSSPSPSPLSVRFVRLACAVFDGRFALDLGLLSSPIVPAIGFVGCTQFRTQTVSPNSRALVKYPD